MIGKVRRYNVFFSILIISLTAIAVDSASAVEITGLHIERTSNGEHVSLRLNEKIALRVFDVSEPPPRVAIDMPVAHWRGTPGLPADYTGGLVQKVRLGFHDEHTSRMVFDLTAGVKLRNVQMMGSNAAGGYWLEFDLIGQAPPATSAQPPTQTRQWRRVPPIATSRRDEKVLPQCSPNPMVVIDAGHGGQDPGTSGRHGTEEKTLTLRYAEALRDALLKTGRFRVTLTRSDDRYLFLRDRVKLARAAKGDLFISLHADSAPTRDVRGLSVYTISETASDKEAAALAAKENKADIIGGMDFSDTSQDVADILIDLAQRETRAKSARFADTAIRYLGHDLHLLSNTHRFAGFAVLKAPDIPSVLIEMGFLTTPYEENQLKSTAYESKFVRALTRAIEAYFAKK